MKKFICCGKDYSAYNGQNCKIVRPLTATEADLNEVGNMYRIEFSDGVQIDAFEDELQEVQQQ